MTNVGPVVVGVLVVAVLTFGLSVVVNKNLDVAPWAETATEGRLHFHTKNTTRFGGTPVQVARAVNRAVTLTDTGPDIPSDWREALRRHLHVSDAPEHVVVLPEEGDQASAFALPGAYWAVYAGAPIVFAGKEQLSAASLQTIRDRRLPVYVLAPASLIPNIVVEQITDIASVERVADENLAKHAIRIAEYRDEENDFGWGRTEERHDGYFQYVVVAPSEAAHAVEALPLARSNTAPLLFAEDSGAVPASTDQYLWRMRAEWFATPAEGPFRHLWLVGNTISYAAQARMDMALEKAPYATLGSVALGPLEALVVVLMALGIAGGIFTWLHGARLLPDVPVAMRIAWTLTTVLFPIGGILLYFAAYRRPQQQRDGMVHWTRPAAIQSAAATAMGFGFGAPLMIVIGYAFVYFGFPLFYGAWADSWLFVFGAGMPLMMAGMYLGAVLIAWPLVQFPMRHMMQKASVQRALWTALGVTALSMAAVSLGMMTVSWWMMMAKAPMMPKEDDILWFDAMWIASMIGYVIAWPLNWPMVRTQLKPGGM